MNITALWLWLETHAMAILSTIFMLGAGKWISAWMTGQAASVYVKAEMEKFRTELHQNPLTSQVIADDAIIDILERTIPEALHDTGEEIATAINNGSLESVDWSVFGKELWAKVEPQIVGGSNDYLKSSSFKDGETLAAKIAERFFKTQAVMNKGLIG